MKVSDVTMAYRVSSLFATSKYAIIGGVITLVVSDGLYSFYELVNHPHVIPLTITGVVLHILHSLAMSRLSKCLAGVEERVIREVGDKLNDR